MKYFHVLLINSMLTILFWMPQVPAYQEWSSLVYGGLEDMLHEQTVDTQNMIKIMDNTVHADFSQTLSTINELLGEVKKSHGFISMFGDEIVGSRNDMLNIQFQYGLSDFYVSSSVAESGTIQAADSFAIIDAGSDQNGFAQLQSKRCIRYCPAHAAYAFFTALFQDGPQDNATQYIGIFDDIDGVAVGYTNMSFSILLRQFGFDTIITQDQFNRDRLDGSGKSGFVLNTSHLNVFRISYGWLGATPIIFQILNEQGEWITFHVIEQPNSSTTSSFSNPTLPMRAQVRKINASVNSVRLKIASWSAGIIGRPTSVGYRYFSESSDVITLPSSAEQNLITIRNKKTLYDKPNKIEIRIAFLSGGSIGIGNTVSLVRLRKNVSEISEFVDFNSQDSAVEISKANVTINSGTSIFALPDHTSGSGSFFHFIPEKDFPIVLLPGESISLTVQNISSNAQVGSSPSNKVVASIGWEERF